MRRNKFILLLIVLSVFMILSSCQGNMSESDRKFEKLMDGKLQNISYDELTQILNEISPEKLTEEIFDTSNPEEMRTLALQYDSSYTKKILLSDLEKLVRGDEGFDIKYAALVRISHQDPDNPILLEVAMGEDDDLAFQALKFIGRDSEANAGEIAKQMLSDWQNLSDEKLRAAIKALAPIIADSNDTQSEIEYINICHEILKTIPKEEIKYSITSSTIFFALKEVATREAHLYLLTCGYADDIMPYTFNFQNQSTLYSMINKDMTDEQMEIVLKSVEISSAENVKPALEAWLKDNNSANDDLIMRVKECIHSVN